MQDEDRGEYDLADDVPVVKRPGRSVPAQTPAQQPSPFPTPSSAPTPQLQRDLRSIPYARPAEEKPSIEQFMDQKVPAALVVGGIAIELLFATWGLPRKEALWAGMRVGLEILISAGLMVPVMWCASKARAFALGPMKTAGLKILAISVAPPALLTVIGTMLRVVPLSWLVAWLLSFTLYFSLLGVFFSLDHDDTWYCIMLIFLVRVAIFLGALLIAL